MSILNQQLMSGSLKDAARDPFSTELGEGGTAKPGFGGYTYAANTEMQEIFGTTPASDRTGPQGDVQLIQGGETSYGPPGARLAGSATTLLGEMAKMIKPAEEGAGELAWSTAGGGRKIAHTISNSGQLRSLKDSSGTVTPGGGIVPNASGAPIAGYDSNNHYGINNWLPGGGAGTIAIEAVPEVTREMTSAERMARSEWNDTSLTLNEQGKVIVEEGTAGTPGTTDETFRPVATVNTGLRNLPSSPDEG